MLLLVCFVLPMMVHAADERKTENDKILIVASYNPDTRRMQTFINEFEQSLIDGHLPYDIVIEDMGCKGISEAHLWRNRLHNILSRYDYAHLKGLILLGQEAWASFLSEGSFPADIPFFGCFASENGVWLPEEGEPLKRDWNPACIDMTVLADSIGQSGGLLNKYDVERNLELMCSLYPSLEHIAFVSDNTYGGISLQALVKKVMSERKDLSLTLIDSRDGEEHAAQLIEGLPRNSAVLIGTWRVGSDGQYLLYSSIDKLLAGNPSLPVFSLTGSGIGSVAIGGYIPEYSTGANRIIQQILAYYRGDREAVRFVPTAEEYRFDRRKLTQFDIPDYKLPSGSVVVDSVESKLKKYEYFFTVGSVAFIVLVSFLVFLFFLYYRNKKLKVAIEHREAELIEAKERAEESDLLKSAFLANMSHEIRTPLNAIVGFSSLLAEEGISPEDRAEYNSIIGKNSNLLLTLINDILDISKLETGKIRFTWAKEDIAIICRQAITTTAHIRKPGVECVFVPSQEPFVVKTDVQRLMQVLINLLTNAGKFTEKGSITLAYEVQQGSGKVLFSVTDTGCGIPREMQGKVFNRFEKLNEFKQGTGLGLAICKQIIQKMGGDIWIDSDYGGGARFVFSHPIDPTAQPPGSSQGTSQNS